MSITKWLIANYKRMSESMFFDPGWEILDPEAIYTLRIYAPSGVFTETAKNGFFSRVGSDPVWAEVAKSIFAPTDFAFLSSLPEDQQPEVKTLLQFAYNRHIRKADTNVTKMV